MRRLFAVFFPCAAQQSETVLSWELKLSVWVLRGNFSIRCHDFVLHDLKSCCAALLLQQLGYAETDVGHVWV